MAVIVEKWDNTSKNRETTFLFVNPIALSASSHKQRSPKKADALGVVKVGASAGNLQPHKPLNSWFKNMTCHYCIDKGAWFQVYADYPEDNYPIQ